MPQTTRLACTEKQSWVGLSHFWKTYTLYLFAICDTDLQSGCHIFGRLTGAEIWLGDQAEAKCRCGRKIKTQSDIFCKLHRQNRLQLFPTRKPNETSQEATLPSHTLLFGHCDFHAYNTEQSERNDQWIFGDVWWELYPTTPPHGREVKVDVWSGRKLEGMMGAGSWYGSCIYTQSYTHRLARGANLHKMCFGQHNIHRKTFICWDPPDGLI